MACNNYLPRFQDQINTGDPLGGLNCTCYSGAMAGDYDTCGQKVPLGERVRELTGDKTGGTTLLQVDSALQRGWNINLDTRVGSAKLTWAQFEAKIDAGRSAILQGSYSVIHGTRFQGDSNFTGNHAIMVPPGWGVMDPLCDGRRAGIYKYHGEPYPKDLLRRFAGTLELAPGNRLGLGYVWCALTRDNQEAYLARVPRRTNFLRYYLVDNKIVKRVSNRTLNGFSAPCSPPKTYSVSSTSPLYRDFHYKNLVRLTDGSRDGWYIASGWAKEI